MPINLIGLPILVIVAVAIFLLKQWVHILKEYERAVIFRLKTRQP